MKKAIESLTVGTIIVATVAMAIETFLRGFQNKNVHGGHIKMAATTKTSRISLQIRKGN